MFVIAGWSGDEGITLKTWRSVWNPGTIRVDELIDFVLRLSKKISIFPKHEDIS
jgi:hypothetical protein